MILSIVTIARVSGRNPHPVHTPVHSLSTPPVYAVAVSTSIA